MPTIRQYAGSATRYALSHKIISGIILIAVAGGGYWEYQRATSTTGVTHYILGTVATGTIVASVSESGQVSSSDSIDIKPQVTGTITWVGVKAGDKVGTGQTIATIDDTTAKQTLQDAENQLAADKLQFQKDQAQAPISFQNDQTALTTAQENLQDDYNSTYNDLVGSYLDLPDDVNGAQEALYGYDFDTKKIQWNMDVLTNLFTPQENTANVTTFESSSVSDYTTAHSDYETALAAYEATPRTANTTALDTLLSQSITMETSVAQTLQTELNFYGAVSDLAQVNSVTLPSKFATVQTSTRSYLSTVNSDLTTLLNDKKTLDNAKQTITNDQQTVTLDQVGNPNGANPISLQISQNSLQKEQQDIQNQEDDLAKYDITAPFSGTMTAPVRLQSRR